MTAKLKIFQKQSISPIKLDVKIMIASNKMPVEKNTQKEEARIQILDKMVIQIKNTSKI